jgi:uncharacterized protein involved in response to NO
MRMARWFIVSFPACKHAKRKSVFTGGLRWLASEPFRLFFACGMLWSVIGVSLWPLFYAGKLGFFPSFVHARLMIEAFGGAFVVGFLGTAGPRMASAPKLTPLELVMLFALHIACGVSHLTLHMQAGDACFLAMLAMLLMCLVIRVAKFRKDWPPPQMLLAMTGLLCGIAGTTLWLRPATLLDANLFRLAGLLLYQGLLLPPLLGIGSFIFPRILGGDFGEPTAGADRRRSLLRAASAAVLIVLSFVFEAWGWIKLGYMIRTLAPVLYLLREIKWCKPAGSLPKGLIWALGTGFFGLSLPAFFYARHIALEHLLYVGGFGLIILVVASRVLFGHSGELDAFAKKSWFARTLIFLVVLAATTRASADFLPAIQISH